MALKVLSSCNMAKKDLLGDFEFKKFDNLSNGIEIPVTNSLKAKKETVQKKVVPTPVVPTKRVEEKKVLPKERKSPIDLPNFNYKGKEEIKPLINVVPTSSPKKVVPTSTSKKVVPTNSPKKQSILDSDIDLAEYGALTTKDERVLYLARRGWSLKVEQRRNALFHYATKYISRKKKRIYLGSVNN
jgi:hypothetical protein